MRRRVLSVYRAAITVNRAPGRARWAMVMLSLGVTLAVLAAPGATAASPRLSADDNRVWAVRPAGADGKPDARTHFTLQSTPGGTVTDQALVTNLSKVPVTFTVYGTDAFNTGTGQYDLLGADKKPTDVGSWMIFSSGTVTVAPNKSAVIPFKLVVPATATPGDHAGGVVVSLLTLGASTGKVNIDARVAVRVYVRIPGNLRPSLNVDSVAARYHGVSSPVGKGRVEVSYTVNNPGNIRLRAHPTLTVTGPFGAKLATLRPDDLPELLPQQKATFTSTIEGVFPAGPLTVTVNLAPYPDPEQPVGQTIASVQGHGYLWAVPWTLLALVLSVALLLGGVWWWRRRRVLSMLDKALRAAREETTPPVAPGKPANAGRALLAVLIVAAATLGWTQPARAAGAVPYTDGQSFGFITLYDRAGKAIKSGSVTDRPFVWRAVSSQAAPAPYNGTGRKATLLAYQPREGAPSGQWSGDIMTASTAYTDPAHPTAQATARDFTLQDFLDEFPARWDGMIQLRIYFGVPNQPTMTAKYVSTDIKVTGTTWAVVGGGPGAGAGGANIPGTTAAGATGAGGGAGVDADPGVAQAQDSNPIAAILPDLGTPGSLVIAAGAVICVTLAGLCWRRRRDSAEES